MSILSEAADVKALRMRVIQLGTAARSVMP